MKRSFDISMRECKVNILNAHCHEALICLDSNFPRDFQEGFMGLITRQNVTTAFLLNDRDCINPCKITSTFTLKTKQ